MTGYFDCNATAPLHPAARQAWLETADRHWHNPSGLYREAGAAKRRLEDIREQVAGWLGCDRAEEIIFLSGATEANNAVIGHAVRRFREAHAGPGPRGTAVISALEHPSLAEPARQAFGNNLRRMPCGPGGVTDLAVLAELLQSARERGTESSPGIVSLQAANNETGVLQPWREALSLCQRHGVAFHCDAAQWIGKLSAASLGDCDFVTGSAHKFGGPKGVGFLKIPAAGPHGRQPFRSLLGGPQEARHRAGTENLPGIAAMAAAWQARERELNVPELPKLENRTAFECKLREILPGVTILAADSPRLWNTVLILIPPPVNVKWLTRLSALGFQLSTGSACSQGGGASDVLRAMGIAEAALAQVLRISATWETTAGDWLSLAQAFAEAAATIHTRAGAGALPAAGI